ncbi:MAG: DUF3035 domain-containing protein [Kiloniellales bacterium]
MGLSACEGVKKQLGLGKQPPDEFRVVSRAPLSLPPDFTLRPPQPGAPRPQEGTATDQARSAVFRVDDSQQQAALDQTVSSDGLSRGEQALLLLAGASKAEPDIRQIVDRETQQINAESEDFINRLVFWREPDQPGVIVDASAEARRLRENAALGKGVTEGRTPTIERKRKALFEGIF